MDLWYAPTSPFARKVRIAAHELGLAPRLAMIEVDPWTDKRLRALNPLAKVPTLVVPGGPTLFESSVICDYLDGLAEPRRLCPEHGPGRWRALLLQGLADGAMTAVGRLFADERRPEPQRSEAMLLRFTAARDATLDRLEHEAFGPDPDIGQVGVAALLGYLDFRWPTRDWRAARPALAAWFARFEARPSMASTCHHIGAGGVR